MLEPSLLFGKIRGGGGGAGPPGQPLLDFPLVWFSTRRGASLIF